MIRPPVLRELTLQAVNAAFAQLAREIDRSARGGPVVTPGTNALEAEEGVTVIATDTLLAQLNLRSRKTVAIAASGTFTATAARTLTVELREGKINGEVRVRKTVTIAANGRGSFAFTYIDSTPSSVYFLVGTVNSVGATEKVHEIQLQALTP